MVPIVRFIAINEKLATHPNIPPIRQIAFEKGNMILIVANFSIKSKKILYISFNMGKYRH